MALVPGTRIGSCEIVATIGAGGMGEVYRARDLKLNRDVAIKVLLPGVVADAERLARFSREAQLLASLNHPNIAHIHGIEETGAPGSSQASRALVLEFVDGEDLAQRLRLGALSIDEALAVARQIADALEAAHDHGIVHRDLKPGNIKVTAEGVVKVLDFGLAKAADHADHSSEPNHALAHSPTITSPAMTMRGVVLGTAAYMAPEQARGRPVGRRADIWAFGCVLFEMLTGRLAFPGEDTTETLVTLLTREPNWTALPSDLPEGIRRLLRRCLEKDPKKRLDSAAAIRLEIDDALAAPGSTATRKSIGPAATLPWAVAAALGVALLASVLIPWRAATESPTSSPIRLLLSEQLPASSSGAESSFAIAPDGNRVVFRSDSNSTTQLFLREMSTVEARPIPGTENALQPFFSPDGQRIGFFADSRIKVLSLAGGAPLVLADATNARGAVWAPDDTIIYAPGTDSGLWQVPATGGTPRAIAQPDSSKGERSYRWPALSPDGDLVLFTAAMSDILSFDDARLMVRSLRTGEQRELVKGGSFGTFGGSGSVLYTRAGALLSVAFDRSTLEARGAPEPVMDGLVTYPISGAAQYSLSRNGTLLYLKGRAESRQARLVWVSRTGQVTPIAVPPATFQNVAVAPDGRRAAVDIDGANASIWVLDFARTSLTRLTLAWSNNNPSWTPDMSRVAFSSARSGIRGLFWQRVDQPTPPEEVFPLKEFAGQTGASTWSPDGRTVVFAALSPGTQNDLWLASSGSSERPVPLVQTSFNESAPVLSPDGRWLAYVSNETGSPEVYVQPFPGPGAKRRISTAGGGSPAWSPNGTELFFRARSAMMSVDVGDSVARAGEPRLLFRHPSTYRFGVGHDRRFLMIENLPETIAARPITVVLNWFAASTSVPGKSP